MLPVAKPSEMIAVDIPAAKAELIGDSLTVFWIGVIRLMAETRVMNCIMCPMGCEMIVTVENGKVIDVKGNTCRVAPNMQMTK